MPSSRPNTPFMLAWIIGGQLNAGQMTGGATWQNGGAVDGETPEDIIYTNHPPNSVSEHTSPLVLTASGTEGEDFRG